MCRPLSIHLHSLPTLFGQFTSIHADRHHGFLSPRDRISAIIRRQRLLQQLFHGEWMTLVALEPEHGQFYRYDRRGEWRLERGGH